MILKFYMLMIYPIFGLILISLGIIFRGFGFITSSSTKKLFIFCFIICFIHFLLTVHLFYEILHVKIDPYLLHFWHISYKNTDLYIYFSIKVVINLLAVTTVMLICLCLLFYVIEDDPILSVEKKLIWFFFFDTLLSILACILRVYD